MTEENTKTEKELAGRSTFERDVMGWSCIGFSPHYFNTVGILIIITLLFPSFAQAEMYVAGFGGKSIPVDTKISASNIWLMPVTGSKRIDSGSLNVEESSLVGFKAGFWGPNKTTFMWGVEIEANRYSLNIPSQKVNVYTYSCPFISCTENREESMIEVSQTVTSFGFNFLGQYRVGGSNEFPFGKYQFYLGLGLGEASVDIETMLDNQKTVNTDNSPFYSLFGGAKYFLSKPTAIFLEYKQMRIDRIEYIFPEELDGDGEQEVEHIYCGVAYHF